jgi:heptosyltransferase-2/heptosyltransferase-3
LTKTDDVAKFNEAFAFKTAGERLLMSQPSIHHRGILRGESTVRARPQIHSLGAATATLKPAALASPVEMCAPVRRIVTIHSSGLQELIFALPALKTLRETFEGASLCAVVRAGLAPLLEGCGLVDEVLLQPEGGLSSQAGLMARLHAHRSDIALAFSPSRKSTLLAWSSGAPTRIGFDGAKMDALLTHQIERKDNALVIEDFLDLVRAAGAAPRYLDYNGLLQVSPVFVREADLLLEERGIFGPFLIFAPQPEDARAAGSGQSRSTPALTQALAELGTRHPVAVIGAQSNRALLRAARETENNAALFDLGGAMEVALLAALCARAQLFIGYAGGVSHLAAAMSTPAVVLCSNEKQKEVARPRGVPFRLLLKNATGEEIARAARELIGL